MLRTMSVRCDLEIDNHLVAMPRFDGGDDGLFVLQATQSDFAGTTVLIGLGLVACANAVVSQTSYGSASSYAWTNCP